MEDVETKVSDCKQVGIQPLHMNQYQNVVQCMFMLMMIHRNEATLVYVSLTEDGDSNKLGIIKAPISFDD